MILFLKLFLAHLIGDFCFQTDRTVAEKETHKIRSRWLYWHLVIHFLALIILLQFQFEYWLGILFIIITHFLFDVWKLYSQNPGNQRLLFFIDQLLHIAVLLSVTYFYHPFTIILEEGILEELILLSTALVLVTFTSSVIIRVIMGRWTPQTNNDETESLAKAGNFIGNLERLLIFLFIVLQHWEVVGFLLAAKSVFRFGDLRESGNRKLTEYILIGTFLSFALAVVFALLFLWVKNYENII